MVGVDRAFIYSSWAARYRGEVGDAPKDVDVLVVGKPDPDELFSVAEVARRSLRREVNIRSVRSAAWDAPTEAGAFLAHIRSRPLVELTVEGAHPMTWQKGRDTVLALVDHGEPESITPSRDQAEAMLADARRHLQSAQSDRSDRSTATSRGGHIVLYDAARAQFDPPLGKLVRPFNRMRARRNQIEYASSENPDVTEVEVLADIDKAEGLISLADKVLPRLDAF